jgi:DNA-binding NarL/FixJ family response regulator
MATRLALVDDHALFRDTLSSALIDHGFELAGQAGDARTAFTVIDRTRPDLVLLDLKLPGMDGMTALREILARPSTPKVMILSAYASPQKVADAWEAGAHGIATKTSSLTNLLDGIKRIVAGERWLAPGLSTEGGNGHALAPLSPRERDVFRMLVRGLTTREIAAQLCISGKTVETHRERIFRKLNVHSAVRLVRFAAANDVLD